jgi:hypothetical protein
MATIQVSRFAQPQARRFLLDGSMFVLRIRSPFASHALFLLDCGSLFAGARVVHPRFATDLNSYEV